MARFSQTQYAPCVSGVDDVIDSKTMKHRAMLK
jgi:hypothetical protein